MQHNLRAALALLGIALLTEGCGSFVARRIAQSPNTYPQWFAPSPRVQLGLDPNLLTNFAAKSVAIGPPAARLQYRIVEPVDYGLRVSATNWVKGGHPRFSFRFAATVPGLTNAWSASPRGTVVLLHGYGESQFAMTPWALRLAQESWRCVLVDLRGHGKSTGPRLYFGTRETHDLSQLLDALARDGQAAPPVAVLGHSYGAALALRWQAVEPRISNVVAIAPYASLSNAVLNIHDEFASWVPRGLTKAGLRKLPGILKVEPAELDTATVLARRPVVALFVVGTDDSITPVADVKRLYAEAGPGSQMVVVPQATHEALPYFFSDLVPPVLTWLEGGGWKAEVGVRKVE